MFLLKLTLQINLEAFVQENKNDTSAVALYQIVLENEIDHLSTTTIDSWVQVEKNSDNKGIYLKIFVPIGCSIVISVLIVSAYVFATKWKRIRAKPKEREENMPSVSHKNNTEQRNKILDNVDYGPEYSFNEKIKD